jgi:hypothetical protein
MLLAHRLWDVVASGETAGLDAWDVAHKAALKELQPEFDANWRRLSTNAQKALRALVGGRGSPFRTQVLEQLDLAKSTARAALQGLVANGTVEQEDEDYVVVDPLFAEWIEKLRETSGEAPT